MATEHYYLELNAFVLAAILSRLQSSIDDLEIGHQSEISKLKNAQALASMQLQSQLEQALAEIAALKSLEKVNYYSP